MAVATRCQLSQKVAVESPPRCRYNSRAVDDEGLFPPETAICGRCASVCDPEDNFCRHCGLPLHDDSKLPSIRNGAMPVAWRPPLPAAVVKGAAFVAAGTLAEMFLRQLVRNAFGRGRGASQPPAGRPSTQLTNREQPLSVETQVVSETFLLRRVRFRR